MVFLKVVRRMSLFAHFVAHESVVGVDPPPALRSSQRIVGCMSSADSVDAMRTGGIGFSPLLSARSDGESW